jgi:hypothetical protein
MALLKTFQIEIADQNLRSERNFSEFKGGYCTLLCSFLSGPGVRIAQFAMLSMKNRS